MKVSNCKQCPYYKEKYWTTRYKPAGYHLIGINHVYAYCEKHKERVLNVKKCEVDSE